MGGEGWVLGLDLGLGEEEVGQPAHDRAALLDVEEAGGVGEDEELRAWDSRGDRPRAAEPVLLVALAEPSAGRVLFRGREVGEGSQVLRRTVGLVFQDADAQVVLNQLYTMTPMQSTFNVIMLAISRGRPVLLTL